MTESEFQRYLDRLDAWNRDAITTALYSDLDPLVQQRHLLALKEKALKSQWMSGDEFEALYKAEIEKLDAGNRQRLQGAFAPFAPFADKGIDSLPTFPVECLPPALGEYARELARCKQVSPDMVAVSALAMVSLAVQKKVLVNPKPGWIEPVNLYTIIIARPSDRKSPVLSAVTAPVYEYVREVNEGRKGECEAYNNNINILTKRKNYIIDQLSNFRSTGAKGAKGAKVTQEDLDAIENQLAEAKKNEIHPLRLVADDTTPEKLSELMARNGGKMAIVSSEGGIFDLIAGRYSDKVNLDVFLKAYPGENIMVDRKTGPNLEIAHPALTILLMAQPRTLSAIMENGDFRGRGFLARFLYSLPKSRVGTRIYEVSDVSQSAKTAYRVLLRSLLGLSEGGEPMRIIFSPEAHQASRAFAEALEPRLTDDLEFMEDWAGKFHGQVVRIAALLHCCQFAGDAGLIPLSEDTFQRARRIGEYFLEHAKGAFQLLGMTEPPEVTDAKYILKRLDTVTGDSLGLKELFDLCRKKQGFESMELFREKLEPLVSNGYLYVETVQTGGRPSEKVYINPEYRAQGGLSNDKF